MAPGANEARLSYEERQRRHIYDLTGGSVWEVNAVCAVASAGLFFWSVLQSRYNLSAASRPLRLTIDFLLNVGAILAASTVYANSLGLLLVLLTLPPLLILLTSPKLSSSSSSSSSSRNPARPKAGGPSSPSPLPDFPIRPYLTAYRAGMMITTAICILAVDFHVFPRRFAKVETYGTSLMDVGVGSFVFSGGLMAAKPYLKTRLALANKGGDSLLSSQQGKSSKKSKNQKAGSSSAIQEKEAGALLQRSSPSSNSSSTKPLPSSPSPSTTTNSASQTKHRLLSALRASLPLLLLGLIRLYSVKGLEYAEHVSEYGVHWNFFFTLGFLPLAMALLDPILALFPAHVPAHMLLGLLITFTHGLCLELSATGFRKWALTAPRVDLLSQNREGVASFAGYLAIFLLGVETGNALLPRQGVAGLGALLGSTRTADGAGRSGGGGGGGSSSVVVDRYRLRTLALLAATSATYALLAYTLVQPTALARVFGLTKFSAPISRRLANPPYVLWIAAFNHFQILLYAAVESVVFPAGVHQAPASASARSVVGHAALTGEEQEAAQATSDVLDAYNAGGLALFLLANLGTGAVNLSVKTLDVRDGPALGILLVYMLACTGAALVLRGVGWKLKI